MANTLTSLILRGSEGRIFYNSELAIIDSFVLKTYFLLVEMSLKLFIMSILHCTWKIHLPIYSAPHEE